MVAPELDVAVVGNFSIDYLKLPRRPEPYTIMGGAVAYVSLVTRRLGGSVAVVSKVGLDFPDAYLQQLQNEGVDTSGIIKTCGEHTTSFELAYSADLSSRTLRLRSQCSPITVADLPPVLNAKAIHIAPIAGEISFEVVKRLRSCCKYLSIDPQGMTRRFDTRGKLTVSAEMDIHLLGLVDIYKSSFDEISILTGKSNLKDTISAMHDWGPKIVIVTMGAQGSVLSVEGEACTVPIYRSGKLVDPTGAGDVFIGAFLNEYVRLGQEPFWCACVGSAAASLVIEGVGTTFFGEKNRIYRRALSIYNK